MVLEYYYAVFSGDLSKISEYLSGMGTNARNPISVQHHESQRDKYYAAFFFRGEPLASCKLFCSTSRRLVTF
jgi:hypothetical protein